MIRVPILVWAIHVISWVRSAILPLFGVALPETKGGGFRPKLSGHVRCQGQSERPIRVMTFGFGMAPPPELRAL